MSDDSITPLTEDTTNVTFFKQSVNARNHSRLMHPQKLLKVQKKGKHTNDINIAFSASKSAISSIFQEIATRKAEWNTKTDRDAQALLEKKLAAEEDDEDDLYKGQNAYKSIYKKTAGPIRVTLRFDYQPDICKDYKEREWEEMQGKIRQDKSEFLIESSDESDEELPFA
ncbi:21931_t:CDS:2, partial [Racocetra persica]